MRITLISFLTIAYFSSIAICQTLPMEKLQLKYLNALQKIFKVQKKIEDVHPFLKRAYPIAIAENDHLFIFDNDSTGRKYIYIKEARPSISLSKGIKAAFPLESYGGKIACIISSDILDSLEGYVTIFHEFIHCHQWDICELKLKQTLEVSKKALVDKNYSWELNHPFPYDATKFNEIYSLFLKALEENNQGEILRCRARLKQMLSKTDYEYMVWQEWKEGFARFIENQIRKKLDLKENHFGIKKPFHRITFYEGGSRFISFLSKQEPELLVDIEKLFYKMLNM